MNSKSRSANSIINAGVGIASQLIVLALTFISRTIFIRTLGAEYLGVNGLYTNILTVLSLAELGVGNVVIYSLYRPIAEQDEEAIQSLLHYYKLIYRKIVLFILILGISFIPFLDRVVDSDLTHENLVLYYVL